MSLYDNLREKNVHFKQFKAKMYNLQQIMAKRYAFCG